MLPLSPFAINPSGSITLPRHSTFPSSPEQVSHDTCPSPSYHGVRFLSSFHLTMAAQFPFRPSKGPSYLSPGSLHPFSWPSSMVNDISKLRYDQKAAFAPTYPGNHDATHLQVAHSHLHRIEHPFTGVGRRKYNKVGEGNGGTAATEERAKALKYANGRRLAITVCGGATTRILQAI